MARLTGRNSALSCWQSTTVDSVSRRVTVGFVGSQSPHFVESGIPLLRGKNIKPYRLDLGDLKFISEETHQSWSKSSLEPGDVAIVRVGYPGVAAVIPDGLGPINAASLVIVKPDKSKLDPHFLAYLLNSPWGKSTLSNLLVGSAQQVLNTSAVAELEIALPPIGRQSEISRALQYFDQLVENNRRRIEILEEMARLLYREWFVNFRFPGHENVEMVDSEQGLIPEGWQNCPFSAVAEFVNGFAFKSSEHWLEEGLPIVKIKELKNGISDDTPRYHGEDIKSKYFIESGDVLFSWSADLDAYVWSGGPALLNQHLFVVRPFELPPLFVFHALQSRMGEFVARAQGTTMKHIKRSALKEVELIIPTPDVVATFEATFAPMASLIQNLADQNRALIEARDLLLPRLVSGELDVSELDLDAVVGSVV